MYLKSDIGDLSKKKQIEHFLQFDCFWQNVWHWIWISYVSEKMMSKLSTDFNGKPFHYSIILWVIIHLRAWTFCCIRVSVSSQLERKYDVAPLVEKKTILIIIDVIITQFSALEDVESNQTASLSRTREAIHLDVIEMLINSVYETAV